MSSSKRTEVGAPPFECGDFGEEESIIRGRSYIMKNTVMWLGYKIYSQAFIFPGM